MIKIYVINLLKAKDRLKNISRHLNELGVEFEVVKGIDGSKIQLPHSSFSKKSYHFMHGKGSNLGELGCYFSHIKALRRFLETNENFALILEDDVTLLKETMLLIDQSILLHSDSWDILRITGLHSGTPIKFKRLFKKFFLTVNLTHQSGAGGYVINRKGADKIIKHLLPMKLPYDHAFDREWLFGAKTLFLQPFPVKQKFDDSYIAPLDSEKKYWIYRIPAAFYRSINSILRIIYRSIQALLLEFNEKVKKPRNKGKFEKLFSLSRHKRRAGAKELSSLIATDFKSQKKKIISGGEIIHTHGSSHSLSEHFSALEKEFYGESELCYTHAKIIVLIRRESKVKSHFELFERLWREESDFLLKSLNTRWLISAADTFSDHSDDDAIKSLSIACICLLNTVKLQESERFLTNADQCKDDKEKQSKLDNEERFKLFDGISVFKFGTDDTLRNMCWRIDKAAKTNIAGEILLEIFKRLQKFDTVYKRAKDRHVRDKTGWW